MNIIPGKYTAELFAEKHNLTKDSAINKLSKLKKQGYAKVSGGGKQKLEGRTAQPLQPALHDRPEQAHAGGFLEH